MVVNSPRSDSRCLKKLVQSTANVTHASQHRLFLCVTVTKLRTNCNIEAKFFSFREAFLNKRDMTDFAA